jgi:hypothetical protein
VKKYTLFVALSLAVVLMLGAGTTMVACGTGDCKPCPMSSKCTPSTAQAQTSTEKAAPCPAICPGDPTKCPNPAGCKDGKGCDNKCSKPDAKSCGKTSATDKVMKQSPAKVKAMKAVEAKAQTVSSPKSIG